MKFCGKVGYVIQKETRPGIWEEVSEERTYRGDVLRNYDRWSDSSKVNGNTLLQNNISILADAYAYHNFMWMKYVEFMGAKWKIDSIEVERPRIRLSLGGLYNGEE